MNHQIFVIFNANPGRIRSSLHSKALEYDKRNEYAARGITEYWIVDPIEEIVFVLNLQNGDYVSRSFTGEATIVSSTFPTLSITAKQVLIAKLNY
jgi:Uma2 family endonuclease